MKEIKVKPVETILIKLEDIEYECTFNMLSMAYMQEELGKLTGRIDEISPAHMAALVLYCGIKPTNESFTVDEANALALKMGPSNYTEIIGMYNDSVMNSMNEKDAKQAKKVLAQLLSAKK